MKLKKLFACITAAAMMAVFGATTAFANAGDFYGIAVGGTYLILNGADKAAKVEGVSCDDAFTTLTFNNLDINTYSTRGTSAGIYIVAAFNKTEPVDLNINLSGDNYVYFGSNNDMNAGIYSSRMNLTFTGSGNLELKGYQCALGSPSSNTGSYIFKPSKGYKMTIYAGNSVATYNEIASATAGNPFVMQASDTEYFSSGSFKSRYLKIETEKLADINIDDINITGDTEHDVYGAYHYADDPGTVYSVDIDWGGMNFTYHDRSMGVWDAEKHMYAVDKENYWSCDEDENKITVTNHSNAEIKATFSFTASDEHKDIEGDFTSDKAAVGSDGYLLPTAEAYNDGSVDVPAGARTADFYFSITSGVLTEDAEAAELGEITITLKEGA